MLNAHQLLLGYCQPSYLKQDMVHRLVRCHRWLYPPPLLLLKPPESLGGLSVRSRGSARAATHPLGFLTFATPTGKTWDWYTFRNEDVRSFFFARPRNTVCHSSMSFCNPAFHNCVKCMITVNTQGTVPYVSQSTSHTFFYTGSHVCLIEGRKQTRSSMETCSLMSLCIRFNGTYHTLKNVKPFHCMHVLPLFSSRDQLSVESSLKSPQWLQTCGTKTWSSILFHQWVAAVKTSAGPRSPLHLVGNCWCERISLWNG